MKFRLADEYLYWWPVEVGIPDPERAGKTIRQKFEARFRAIPADEAQAMQADVEAIADPAERFEAEHRLLTTALTDWRDVIGEDGEPADFTSETLRQAMRHSWFRLGLYRAFVESLSGEGGRRKN